MIFVQTKLKRGRTKATLQETGESVSTHDIEEEDIVDDEESAASYTLMEERRTARKKISEEMELLSSI